MCAARVKVLALRGWGAHEWDAMYSDLPSRQRKLAVADRSVITTTADETRAVAPRDLQPALDALAARFSSGRCFVRPSGTEDVVRVYAEAATQARGEPGRMPARAHATPPHRRGHRSYVSAARRRRRTSLRCW